jgi:cytochrome c oxidase subunit 1
VTTETTVAARYELSAAEKRFVGQHVAVAVAALAVGSLFGPLQAFEYAGVDIYQYIEPLFKSYYQGLTLHGVLNALIWTTFFITGFLTLTTIYGLKRPLRYPGLNRIGFWTMVVGLGLAAVPILLDEATVLYTFYPPLQANWAFYAGLTLVVVGSWIEGYGFFFTWRAWRRDNPRQRTPLMAFGGLVTMAMWQIATIGVAVEILTMLLPWALGWIEGTDPELARTYFWFTGHPLVYFWLLPAYVSWYAMLPRQVGGRLFSDSLARLAFWLFLLLSIPVGFHHQFVDPGVPAGWKWVHTFLTFAVFFPSMITAFTVIASLEDGGRRRGGRGWLGWITKLPWSDPSVSAQLLAGLLFMFGGIGGLINASFSVNQVVHNTAWVSGHFHLTVATAVTLSFMGIAYWLVPYVTGKELWNRRLAGVQTWLWAIGMTIFSMAMHSLGLLGAPRRTKLGEAPYVPDEWSGHLLRVGIGGAILLASAVLFVLIMVKTAYGRRPAADRIQIPQAESIHDPQVSPAWLDRWIPWIVATVVLVIIAYGPQLWQQIANMDLSSPGFTPW